MKQLRFFAHLYFANLVKYFSYVVIWTARTRQIVRFALIEIVGVTSTFKTFTIVHAHLQFEKEDNYTWALQCLNKNLFSSTKSSVIITDCKLALINAVEKNISQVLSFVVYFSHFKECENARKEVF